MGAGVRGHGRVWLTRVWCKGVQHGAALSLFWATGPGFVCAEYGNDAMGLVVHLLADAIACILETAPTFL